MYTPNGYSSTQITFIRKIQQTYVVLVWPAGVGRGAENMASYTCIYLHDDVIKWKHFPRYWPFVRGIHRSPVNSPHKGLNERLSKQSWRWWFETPSRPLWRHWYVGVIWGKLTRMIYRQYMLLQTQKIQQQFALTFTMSLGLLYRHWGTHKLLDKPKRRQPKRRQTETSTDRNVDKLITSTNPKRQTEATTNRNVDTQKFQHNS